MAQVRLLLQNQAFPISAMALHPICTKFPTNPLPSQYRVQSNVSIKVFKLFLSSLKGEKIKVTKANFKELSTLCDEFGFELESSSYRLSRLETTIEELKAKIEHLSSEITSLRIMPAITTRLSTSLTRLRSDVCSFRISTIISDLPAIFEEFRGNHFEVLWRGSRDGFQASEFHGRCDGHENTLTVILDTNGNIFGGFTPVRWESGDGYKADNNRKSFVFTLKNPNNIPARKFALMPNNWDKAIDCEQRWASCFGYSDIAVSDKCNLNNESYSRLGDLRIGGSYSNDTGLNGERVFTGSYHFKVKEIEVFEITD
jgi:hypothetical protein